MRLCRYVKLLHPSIYPPTWSVRRLLGRVVRKGDVLEDGCVVGMCVPEGFRAHDEDVCVIWSSTEIEYARLVKYSVERLTRNYRVVLDYGSSRDTYIYPIKVWDTINSIVDGFEKGVMKQQGAILYGPPGVGKSSVARILAEILGLSVIEFTPANVLSMYVGKTEERASKLFDRAEALEPSLVLMDDAEWALTSRSALASSFTSGTSVYLGLINIILGRVERWFREGRRCMVIATTNVSKDRIDPALQRGGRLGKPIYIPLPDAEAVEELLRSYGVEERVAREWAVRVVNAGLSMADAVNIARDLVSGREPMIEPQHGVSYRRFVPQDPGQVGGKLLDLMVRSAELDKVVYGRRRWAYWIPYNEAVSLPLAGMLFGYRLKFPTLFLVDYRGFDEALDAATSIDGVLMIPHDMVPQDILSILLMKCDKVVLCGISPPKFSTIPRLTIPQYGLVSVERNVGVAEVVLTYYGIRMSERDVRIVKDVTFDKLLKVLEVSASHGISLEDAWRLGGGE